MLLLNGKRLIPFFLAFFVGVGANPLLHTKENRVIAKQTILISAPYKTVYISANCVPADSSYSNSSDEIWVKNISGEINRLNKKLSRRKEMGSEGLEIKMEIWKLEFTLKSYYFDEGVSEQPLYRELCY